MQPISILVQKVKNPRYLLRIACIRKWSRKLCSNEPLFNILGSSWSKMQPQISPWFSMSKLSAFFNQLFWRSATSSSKKFVLILFSLPGVRSHYSVICFSIFGVHVFFGHTNHLWTMNNGNHGSDRVQPLHIRQSKLRTVDEWSFQLWKLLKRVAPERRASGWASKHPVILVDQAHHCCLEPCDYLIFLRKWFSWKILENIFFSNLCSTGRAHILPANFIVHDILNRKLGPPSGITKAGPSFRCHCHPCRIRRKKREAIC